MQWAMEKASQANLVITLFSSPLGHRLYSSLGFTVVANVRTSPLLLGAITSENDLVEEGIEADSYTMPAMLWTPTLSQCKFGSFESDSSDDFGSMDHSSAVR